MRQEHCQLISVNDDMRSVPQTQISLSGTLTPRSLHANRSAAPVPEHLFPMPANPSCNLARNLLASSAFLHETVEYLFSALRATLFLLVRFVLAPRQTAEELRERFFGDELEMQSYGKAYGIIWEHDAADTSYRPGSNGETVVEVATRIRALIEVGKTFGGCKHPRRSGQSKTEAMPSR